MVFFGLNKTANRQEKLTYLEDNIRVGNSLIDDPKIVGNLAFNWNEGFSEIIGDGGFDVIVGKYAYLFSKKTRPNHFHRKLVS